MKENVPSRHGIEAHRDRLSASGASAARTRLFLHADQPAWRSGAALVCCDATGSTSTALLTASGELGVQSVDCLHEAMDVCTPSRPCGQRLG
uniref:hypothetical protein n=1 Tax=Streptomyces sp. CA-141956 TaxID=3240051 RepID=UPI003F492A91